MKTETNSTTTHYNIYPKTTGRKSTDPVLLLTLRAMDEGQYIFVNATKQREVHSFKRSLNKQFTTTRMRDGKLKVLCTETW